MTRVWIGLAMVIGGCEGTFDRLSETPRGPDLREELIDESAPPDVAWAPSGFLTTRQFAFATYDLLGVMPAEDLPAENRVDLFVNNAFQHEASLLSEDIRAAIAEDVAASMNSESLATRVGCLDDCSVATLAPFFQRAFRRELPADEQEALSTLVTEADNPVEGLRLLIEVVLRSPQFLYRFEEPQTGSTPDRASPIDDFGLASRLSFFLWNSGPDERLLDLASSNALSDPATLRTEVARMLDDERFGRSVMSFHEQWLSLDAMSRLEKSDPTFAGAGTSWRESFDGFIATTFDRGLRELLTTSELALTEDLAPLYGFEPTAPLASYRFAPEERAGLLSHPAMMAKLAFADQDSPIARGVFVMERLLCREPPPPPMDVDLTPPPVDPDSTSRERFDTLTGVEPCVGCHQLFNPIGYLFGNFDATGRYIETSESGRPIEAEATVLNLVEGVGSTYSGPVEFAHTLADSPAVSHCVAEHWLRYAVGRPLHARDARSVHEARTAFDDSDGDFRELMRAIAESPAFRLHRIEEDR
ncbi:MAG: DUF1592 domain-containing protein [Myxococcota bacterium]